MDLIEDQSDDAGRSEVALPEPARAPSRRTAALAVAAVAAAACAGLLSWSVASAPGPVALAVPAGGTEAALASLRAAGIRAESRDGLLLVPAADASRAASLAAPAAPTNAVADALQDESIFSSGESSRARRTAAVIRELEASIAMQPGVERASVVLGEPPRAFAPGAAAGPSASVTVRMRAGAMPDDLVDAVAQLVAGACQGMRPESVAIIDARAGRARRMRSPDERAAAESRRLREDRAAALLLAALSDLAVSGVRVVESEGGAMVAEVSFAEGAAAARAAVAERAEPLLTGLGACPVAVRIVDARASSPGLVERVSPEPRLGERSTAADEASASSERERTMPLGSALPAGGLPVAWTVVAVAGLGALAWWTWRRQPARAALAGFAAAGEGVPDFDADPAPFAEASDLVRGAPEDAAAVVSSWLEAGDDSLAARLVVAVDARSSAALLRSLPVAEVRQVTDALAALGDVAQDDLAEAVEAFLSESFSRGR